MTRIRAVIVDDEPLARTRIRALLKKQPDIDVAAECTDAFEAVAAIRKEKPDLVFLDVQMPEKDGFSVIEEIGPDRMPVVVFVTAHDEHALRAFQARALDYLLKPFEEARFREALERVRTLIRGAHHRKMESELVQILQDWRARPQFVERISVTTAGRIRLLRISEVDWFQAEGNYVRIHSGGADYIVRETLSNLEAQLDPQRFVRIHRATIVNLDCIQEIQPLFHGSARVLLRNGATLQLSRRFRDRLPK